MQLFSIKKTFSLIFLIRISKPFSAIFMFFILAFSTTASAERALAAGSIYQINEIASVQGTGFNANETVRIRLIDPNGNSSNQSATADNEGNLSVSLVLSDEGTYFAVLMDSNDDPVLSVSMIAM